MASKYSVACGALSANWDAFYTNHSTKFFKDRAWLFTEFPRLDPKVCSEQVVLEIGCGNGSNILPLIEASRDMEEYRLYGCDFAPKSVELVSQHELVKVGFVLVNFSGTFFLMEHLIKTPQ